MSRRLPAICLIAITVIWVLIFATFPAGLFLIDETIQAAAIDAMARNGSLFVQNDEVAPGHPALRLWLLRAGIEGLTPQYPAGFALIAAPFWLIGGVKGVMALNFAAALVVAALTGLIARNVIGSAQAGIAAAALIMSGTFLADYAFALWPHSVAVAISTFALWSAWRSVSTGDWRWSLAAGLALGIGGTIRVDVWFLVPALAMWAVLVSPRPIRDLIWAGVGLAPGLLAAAALNWIKFGHFFPASYGYSSNIGGSVEGGGVHVGSYNFMILTLALAFVACAIGRAAKPVWGWLTLVAGLGCFALLEGGADFFAASLRGYWVLGVDLRDFKDVDIDPTIRSTPEGGVIFFFTLKKALAQSMPWLGILPVLWLLQRTEDERRFTKLLGITTVTLMFFFASREWHGGLSSNLRYFLALTPLFTIGAVFALTRLPGHAGWGWAAGGATAVIVPALFLGAGDSFTVLVLVEQILPPFIFVGLMVLALSAALSPERWRKVLGAASRISAGAAIIIAFLTAYAGDVLTSQSRRQLAEDRSRLMAETPARSMVFNGDFAGSWPVFTLSEVNLVAARHGSLEIVTDLAPTAFDQGWRVFADLPKATKAILTAFPSYSAEVISETPYRAEIMRGE